MLKNLRVVNYRGFATYTLNLAERTYLVGPNNAGKSSLLTTLRLADMLIRAAHQRNPSDRITRGDSTYLAYPFALNEFPALRESVRHNFLSSDETMIELVWFTGSSLTAIWPAEDDSERASPVFYLQSKKGMQPRSITQVKSFFPRIGVIPILSPVDYAEVSIQDKTVKSNIGSRIASRNLRNQIRMLSDAGELDDFKDFALPWLMELTDFELNRHLGTGGQVLDLMLYEQGSRVPKEIVWAGDGIQIWFQILYHSFRLRESATIVLDEPEVYLHPDLQRRLVALLNSLNKQVVMATHSSEIVGEVEPDEIVLVDRLKKRSVRARSTELENQIGASIGSQFNLKLAKALRSKAVLFVEGDDIGLLRPIFKALGLPNLELERNVTIIALGGFTGAVHVEPFDWLIRQLLPDALQTFIALDRDYRTDQTVMVLEQKFSQVGIDAHIWRRKELESYLLTPEIVARRSDISFGEARILLESGCDSLADDVFGKLVAQAIQDDGRGSQHHGAITSATKKAFDAKWKDPEYRYSVVPPKKLIAAVNSQLQANGKKALGFRALARQARKDDVTQELVDFFTRVEVEIK